MYPFQSTGVKTATDPLRLDGADTFKGNLHYTAEFIPTMKLKGIKFESHSNEINQAVAADDDSGSGVVSDSASSISSSDEEAQAVPDGVTIKGKKRHTRAAKSTDTTATSATQATAASSETQPPVEEGIEMSVDELMTHRVFQSSFLRNLVYICLQSPVLLSSTSSRDNWPRKRGWKYSWTTGTGLASVLREPEAPKFNGIMSEKVSSRSSTLVRSG